MDSRRIDPAMRRRLGMPSSMYNVTERSAPVVGKGNTLGNTLRDIRGEWPIDPPLNPDVNVQPGPGGAEYQGNVEEPLSAPQVGATHVQGSYEPPLLPEVAGAAHRIKGTLSGPEEPVTGERNGVHRGYDAVTDYEAMFDHFTER